MGEGKKRKNRRARSKHKKSRQPNKKGKKMVNAYTENLEDFGYREQDEAKDIFEAWKKNGLPQDFENDGVKLAFNMNSGFVFLTNAEYQVAMCGDDQELYSFYTSPYEGKEGSFEDLLEEYEDMHREDKQWFKDIAKNINREKEII